MKILINDKPVDISLDTEKTLGDIMSGIEQWIYPSGSRIQKIRVNGSDITLDTLGDAFSTDIKSIEKLEICINPWREFAAEALGDLYETCSLYESSNFDDRAKIMASWENSSAARFLYSDIPDIYNLAVAAMSGKGLSSAELNILIEERLREITDPQGEIDNSENLVKITSERMEELPLDMQTGKDERAAETMQLFSKIGEKLFRIFFIYKLEGLEPENILIDELSAGSFIKDLNLALKELFSAYENHDIVLVGDIAEYELAPKLQKFFSALKNISKQGLCVLNEP